MTRRTALALGAAASASLPSQLDAQAASRPAVFELRYFRLRTSGENQMQRLTAFLKDAYLPAALRAGAGPVGFFAPVIAQQSPFVLSVRSYASMTGMEQSWSKLGADVDYQKAVDAFTGGPGLGYMRIETHLLRAFESTPVIEAPPAEPARPGRVFELRTYESNNYRTLRKKIGMFNNGEIAIFRKTGLAPVFFGEMLFGPDQPCLVYMLAFDNLAAREKNWTTFINDPDWQKLRATPGLSDAEIVSNISNSILRALPFSQIR